MDFLEILRQNLKSILLTVVLLLYAAKDVVIVEVVLEEVGFVDLEDVDLLVARWTNSRLPVCGTRTQREFHRHPDGTLGVLRSMVLVFFPSRRDS